MAVYMVSFTIHSDSTYQDRYDSFMEQIKKGGLWWGDTTSFVAVRTDESMEEFCNRIYFKSSFDPAKDLFLILDYETQNGYTRGHVKDSYIFTLMPFVRKL